MLSTTVPELLKAEDKKPKRPPEVLARIPMAGGDGRLFPRGTTFIYVQCINLKTKNSYIVLYSRDPVTAGHETFLTAKEFNSMLRDGRLESLNTE